ncbi:hypothetical protein HanPI659440_Chr14g0559231 [Helianthus annuus]|nr:hypothetical protein HanPI659440_Chr14g0559231 [Helianthus annuus]
MLNRLELRTDTRILRTETRGPLSLHVHPRRTGVDFTKVMKWKLKLKPNDEQYHFLVVIYNRKVPSGMTSPLPTII